MALKPAPVYPKWDKPNWGFCIVWLGKIKV